MSTNKNSIIKGTITLTVAGIITRIIGFYNRIFLSNLIGARELGIYQLIFPIYMVAFSFCCQGISLSLTKLVSEYVSRNNMPLAKRLLKIGMFISISLGILASFVIHHYSSYFANTVLRSDECTRCLEILSYGIPFISIKGCINGYFLGLKKSGVNAGSQLIEQVARVGGIYIIYLFIRSFMVIDASIAVWGIVIGEAVSTIYTIIAYSISNHKEKKNRTNYKSPSNNSSYGFTTKLLLKDSIPLTTNRLSLTVLQSLESVLIPSMLMLYYNNNDLSLELYGTLTGIALPFIMFPSTITNSLSTMLLPAISSANATTDDNSIKKITERSMHFCLLIGILSTGIFLVFGKDLGTIIFANETSGELLFSMALLCPFIYLATTISSILNGLGKTTMNLIYFILSIAIRIAFILFVIPKVGIKGYMWGLLVSYLFLTLLVFISIMKNTHVSFNPIKSLIMPSAIAAISSFITYYFYSILCECTNVSHFILLGILLCINCIIYLASLAGLKLVYL